MKSDIQFKAGITGELKQGAFMKAFHSGLAAEYDQLLAQRELELCAVLRAREERSYRWYFRAHSVKSLECNILGFVGIAPVSETLIGMVGNMKAEDGRKWLGKLAVLGRSAA
jgi:hypothetical protein